MQCPKCGGDLENFRNPVPTVDAIIEVGDKIVLVQRRNPPHGWALPGGFVDYGETLEDAVRREALEETGLEITLKGQFHSYSRPDRDPRLHTITTVFLATAEGCPIGGDDALQAVVFGRDDLPVLVFDHRDILNDYYKAK